VGRSAVPCCAAGGRSIAEHRLAAASLMTPLQSQALPEVHEHELVEPVDVGTTGAFASRFPGVVEATDFVRLPSGGTRVACLAGRAARRSAPSCWTAAAQARPPPCVCDREAIALAGR
jgi:hypothetical protein